MSISAMKQALDFLEWFAGDDHSIRPKHKAPEIAVALRQAIAEAEMQEPEPVAWMTINECGEEDDIHYENPEGHLLEGWTYKPLYTHPPSLQALRIQAVGG